MVLTAQGGIENNNPGNIRTNAIHWKGSITNAGAFVAFATPEDGIRAMAKVLRAYNAKYGVNKVSGILNRWAPPSENPTTNYISFVSRKIDKKPNEKITKSDFPALISAMIEFENGSNPYDAATILRGIKKP